MNLKDPDWITQGLEPKKPERNFWESWKFRVILIALNVVAGLANIGIGLSVNSHTAPNQPTQGQTATAPALSKNPLDSYLTALPTPTETSPPSSPTPEPTPERMTEIAGYRIYGQGEVPPIPEGQETAHCILIDQESGFQLAVYDKDGKILVWGPGGWEKSGQTTKNFSGIIGGLDYPKVMGVLGEVVKSLKFPKLMRAYGIQSISLPGSHLGQEALESIKSEVTGNHPDLFPPEYDLEVFVEIFPDWESFEKAGYVPLSQTENLVFPIADGKTVLAVVVNSNDGKLPVIILHPVNPEGLLTDPEDTIDESVRLPPELTTPEEEGNLGVRGPQVVSTIVLPNGTVLAVSIRSSNSWSGDHARLVAPVTDPNSPKNKEKLEKLMEEQQRHIEDQERRLNGGS